MPYLHLDDKDEAVAEEAVRWARALAVSGTVAQIPSGPAGVPPQLWPASVRRTTPMLALPPGQSALVVRQTAGLTIREAVDEGIFGRLSLEAARRRVGRAGIKATDYRSDGQHEYAREDLGKAARRVRMQEAVDD